MSKFFWKVFIVFSAVFILSIGVDVLYRHAYNLQYQLPHNLWIFPAIKNQYALVKTGNSHAGEGITFDAYKVKSLTLSGSAYSFDYDLANLKMYSRQIKPDAVIVIDVSQISFLQQTENRDDNLQATFYDGQLSPFLIPHLKVSDYFQSQIFPFLRSVYLWRQRYNTQILQRISLEERWVTPTPTPTPTSATSARIANVPTNPANYFRVDDIHQALATSSAQADARLVDSMNFIFNKWYKTSGFGTQYFASNRKDLEELIVYCLQQKWRPVLITVPISRVLLAGLLPDFMQTNVYDNIAKTNLHGVVYIDFSNDTQITRNSALYSDSDHLNKNGAAVFSYQLLQTLIEKGYLSKSVDGYDYSHTAQ